MDNSDAEGGQRLSGAVNASPFQPGKAGSFDAGAKPFVPPAAGGGLKPSASSSSLGISTVHAAPFVPAGPAKAPSSAGLSTSAAQAAPFVPPAPAGNRQRPGKEAVNVNAMPFVPKSPGSDARVRQAGAGVSGGDPAVPSMRGLPEGDDLLGMTAHSPGGQALLAAKQDPGGGPRGGDIMAQMASVGISEPNTAPYAPQGRQQYSAPGYQHAKVGVEGRPVPPHPYGGRGQGPLQESIYTHGGRGGRGGGFGGYGGGRGGGRSGRYGGSGRGRAVQGHSPAGPGRTMLTSRFISDRLRAELQQRAHLVQAQVNPELDDAGLPEKMNTYHTLYPLEDLAAAEERPSMAYGVRTFLIKGISAIDGNAYALRWVDGRQLILTGELLSSAHEVVEKYVAIAHHPHLVCPRQVFATKELDDTASIVFAYDYHPGAVTMEMVHLQPAATKNGLVRNACTEEQLWSYLVQISSALRALHTNGRVARAGNLIPSKVLLTSAGRVRLGSLGVLDIMSDNAAVDLHRMQREDLTALGRLMLALACSTGSQIPSLDYINQYFSTDFVTIIRHLLSSAEGGTLSNGKQLVAVLGERVMVEMESSFIQNDALITELSKECENGRLLKILVKLGCVNERPDGDMDMQWSETGDRYLLKLFRDFVFHQTSEEGFPVIDWGHIVEALNKLDAGVQEKILLLSRDEMSMLVASYADIKKCAEGAFDELKTRATQGRMLKSQHHAMQSQQHHPGHPGMDPHTY